MFVPTGLMNQCLEIICKKIYTVPKTTPFRIDTNYASKNEFVIKLERKTCNKYRF